MNQKRIRTRFAPSPTGYLHVGGARTALFNYAFAKHFGGDFILRIDDTDTSRHVDDATIKLMKDLSWLGITWDAGLNLDGTTTGKQGPYRQSDRKQIYLDHAQNLITQGLAYYCFLPDNTDGNKKVFRDYPLDLSLSRIANGDKYCIRFKVPAQQAVIVNDLIRGQVVFQTDILDDFVIIRGNNLPTYNFATVVDDHLMDITHVIRADEHLNNTLPQILIYQAFNWDLPDFAHLSLILGSDRSKLSKRHGAASVGDFKDKGYLSGSVLNYLSLLGWSHPQQKDIFNLSDLITNFSLDKVNPAPAIFDDVKLTWMNGVYMRNLSKDVVIDMLKNMIDSSNIDLNIVYDLYHNKAVTINDYFLVFNWTKPNFNLVLDSDALIFLKDNINAKNILIDYIAWLDTNVPFLDFVNSMKSKNLGGKDLFWTLRISAIGSYSGPDNKLLTDLISKDILIDRANQILKLIND